MLAGTALFAGLSWLTGWAQTSVDLEKLRARAEQADVDAQNQLGSAYNEGKAGLKQDYAEALKWFRQAADKGYAPALYNLGLAYDLGHGVPADDKQAFKYYLMAAEQGFAAAQYNVGNMYAAELCFTSGVHPLTPVGEVADLPRLVRRAHQMLDLNKARWNQSTTGDLRERERMWVFRRDRSPCRRCGTPVAVDMHGPAGRERASYWCPSCQPLPASSASSS